MREESEQKKGGKHEVSEGNEKQTSDGGWRKDRHGKPAYAVLEAKRTLRRGSGKSLETKRTSRGL